MRTWILSFCIGLLSCTFFSDQVYAKTDSVVTPIAVSNGQSQETLLESGDVQMKHRIQAMEHRLSVLVREVKQLDRKVMQLERDTTDLRLRHT